MKEKKGVGRPVGSKRRSAKRKVVDLESTKVVKFGKIAAKKERSKTWVIEGRKHANVQTSVGRPKSYKAKLLDRIDRLGDQTKITRGYCLPIWAHMRLSSSELMRFVESDCLEMGNLYQRVDSMQEVVNRMSIDRDNARDTANSKQAVIESLKQEIKRLKRYKDSVADTSVIPVIDGMTEAERVIAVNVLQALRNSPNKSMFLNKLRFAIGSDALSGFDGGDVG